MTRLFSVTCAAIFVMLGSGPHAHGQFRLDVDQLAAANNAVDELVVPEAAPQARNQFAVQQNIDAWVFNQHGNASQAKKFLERQLNAKLANYADLFDLSPAQQNKLEIAGQGDIASYFAEVQTIRSEFDDQVDQAEFNRVWQRIQPLQMRMQRGLFSQDSLIAKITKRTLNEKQRARCQAIEQERIEFAYQAAIKLTIAEVEKSTPLLASQRQQIVDLLEQAERPKATGQYLHYFVLYRMTQSQQQLGEILAPEQVESLSQVFNLGQALQPTLKQQGLID